MSSRVYSSEQGWRVGSGIQNRGEEWGNPLPTSDVGWRVPVEHKMRVELLGASFSRWPVREDGM